MTAAAVARMGELADDLCDRLDDIIRRVTRHDPVLWIERERSGFFVVADIANDDEVMLRSPDLEFCERFMRAFVAKTPGATLDAASLAIVRGAAELRMSGFSVRVDAFDNVIELPVRDATA